MTGSGHICVFRSKKRLLGPDKLVEMKPNWNTMVATGLQKKKNKHWICSPVAVLLCHASPLQLTCYQSINCRRAFEINHFPFWQLHSDLRLSRISMNHFIEWKETGRSDSGKVATGWEWLTIKAGGVRVGGRGSNKEQKVEMLNKNWREIEADRNDRKRNCRARMLFIIVWFMWRDLKVKCCSHTNLFRSYLKYSYFQFIPQKHTVPRPCSPFRIC